MTLSIDDAIALFVRKLRTAPALTESYDPKARHTTEGCDVRVTDVLGGWWHQEHRNKVPMPNPGEKDYAPFHDAAWELAHRGILRPGPAFPGLRRRPTQRATVFRLPKWGASGYRNTIKKCSFPPAPAALPRF